MYYIPFLDMWKARVVSKSTARITKVDLFIDVAEDKYSVADILVASDDHFASTAAENIRQEGVAYLKSHKDQYTTSIQVCLTLYTRCACAE